MRIAQVAPLEESVPPKLYGGTERVVCWLIDELIELGHEVCLFASADSGTRAKLVPCWPRAMRLNQARSNPAAAYAVLLQTVAAAAPDFDVIHCHLDWLHLPLLQRLGVPFVTTLHGRLDHPDLSAVVRSFPQAPFVSISDHQRTALPNGAWLGTVHHGLPGRMFRLDAEPEDYLAFLGRICPEKGPDVAIRLAQRTGRRLKIAAKTPRREARYFQTRVAPLIDGQQIELVGEIGDAGKPQFLGKAAALLFPIDWPEPFGLVMIEAMACGTPVIAFRRGSVPEIVEDGVSGFIVESEAEAVAAIGRLHELDRREVRWAFERRFTARRMAEAYLAHYQAIGPGRAAAREYAQPAQSRDWAAALPIREPELDSPRFLSGKVQPETGQ